MEDATIIKIVSMVLVGGIIGILIYTGQASVETIVPLIIGYLLPSPVTKQ